uniref:Thioredoxin-like fold domain-containing protein n=2 Tax=Leptocylindrus danicus TaxID=163516 RepID=A0A7S2KF89_9STRA|mmetsp:Transcript_22203/g.33323  ORF Transcript_22203/g.33323 Transcript_22203/m.33323 type:complete len:296 (+) Transcript_22203:107-994(+)
MARTSCNVDEESTKSSSTDQREPDTIVTDVVEKGEEESCASSSLLGGTKSRSRVKGVILSLICNNGDSNRDLKPALYYFPFHRETLNSTNPPRGRIIARTRRERKRQARLSSNEQNLAFTSVDEMGAGAFRRTFDPTLSEFTLLFFASTNCHNSNRVAPIVSDFLSRANGSEDLITSISNTNINNLTGQRKCQCIHVSQDNFALSKSFCKGGGYYTLSCESGYHHSCHLLFQILFVHSVPCVVVVDNSNGKVVTDWGLQAIEYNGSDANYVLQAWRNSEPGLSVFQKGYGSCLVS